MRQNMSKKCQNARGGKWARIESLDGVPLENIGGRSFCRRLGFLEKWHKWDLPAGFFILPICSLRVFRMR